VRSLGVGAVLAALVVGCGGQAKSAPVVTDASSLPVTPSVTRAARSVPASVIARVKRSVLPVSCFDPNAGDGFLGTGFRVGYGVVTASHVVSACPPSATIDLGYGDGAVLADDPTHDLALVTYREYRNGNTGPGPMPLQQESRRARVGEPVALLGFPGLSSLGNPFKRQVRVLRGTIAATNHTQLLESSDGERNLLRNTIEVAVVGVAYGESGGPAVDSAGKVVGVIVGSASGIATLTPVTDLTSLH
jgi:S1-C subfamily serine protease